MTFLSIMNDIGLRVGLSEPLHACPTGESNLDSESHSLPRLPHSEHENE
jgi:hypothetical protein